MKKSKIIHAGKYDEGPAYCGIEATESVFASYRRSGENDLIFGYRTFCEWLVSDKVPSGFTFCEECVQSPDIALHMLGHLDED